ncbi:hypothetical protein CLV58_109237 [Spirosoma oryzae]|uniref:DUF5983 domain-containing protein n=1 Tax=Spirosoma oryzae TaxID=1469603 RepID=A0A2T0SYL7_9BACT|nr:hypothetical protein [Spirosoma oryzae]PRY38510.1 hypothetical protein CLV58_109237 [Spirosoma oryzae]
MTETLPSARGIYTYLDCSDSHLTPEDIELIKSIMWDENPDPPVLLLAPSTREYNFGYGYFLYSDTDGETPQEMGISENLHRVMEFAKSLGCNWIKLDPDGLIHEELPQYDH